MGVFWAPQLVPHLFFFASRTWNLFSNSISSHCLICCPWQHICSHSCIPATPQNYKHQFCWFEALLTLTPRLVLTITVQVWRSEFTAAFTHYFAETFTHASILLFQSTQNNLFYSLCWTAKHVLHILIRIHFIQSVANTEKCAIHLVMCKNTLQIICLRSGEFLN